MTLVFDRTPTFIDLFCGAGGLSPGFQQAGFRCVAAIDCDEASIETYWLNFSDHIVRREEIAEGAVLPPADVIIGGPPCQGFSSAGKRRLDDKRNSLVRAFAELIVREKPKAFVFENVEGFVTASKGELLRDPLEPLVQTGYRIHLRKVNAANYGVPQHRKRILAIGGLGWDPTFPAPTHMDFGAPGASNAFQSLPPCPTLANALSGLPQPAREPPGYPQGHHMREISALDLKRIKILKPGQSMRDLPQELWHDSYQRRAFRRVMDGIPTERRGGARYGLRRLHTDQPSKAITSGAISEFVHPSEDRFLTLRECARIQTFPDAFAFAGARSECMLQIANAVPPLLAKVIAATLRDDLQTKRRSVSIDRGALLSFVPTPSSGMSPALQSVWEMINARFLMDASAEKEQ